MTRTWKRLTGDCLYRRILLTLVAWLFCRTIAVCDSYTRYYHLSGSDKDHRVEWQFMVTDGARSGQWTTIGVPSCWEQECFGCYNYGHDRTLHHEQGLYRTTFKQPDDWSGHMPPRHEHIPMGSAEKLQK